MSTLRARATRVLSPASGFLLFAQAAIVVTGGAVRLTGSGLGCPTWPECTPGSYTPKPYQVEEQVKVWIEFGNRLLTFVLVLAAITVVLSVLAAGRKDLRGLALGQILGIVGQGVLGGITVLTGLHPATVGAHCLDRWSSIAASSEKLSIGQDSIRSLSQKDCHRAHHHNLYRLDPWNDRYRFWSTCRRCHCSPILI